MGFTTKHLTCHIRFSVCNVSQWGQHYMPTAITLLKAHWVTRYAVFKSVLILKLNSVHANVNMTITALPANCTPTSLLVQLGYRFYLCYCRNKRLQLIKQFVSGSVTLQTREQFWNKNHQEDHRTFNLITVQQDATYSVYYISVGSSACFECWHPSSGAHTTVITASGID